MLFRLPARICYLDRLENNFQSCIAKWIFLSFFFAENYRAVTLVRVLGRQRTVLPETHWYLYMNFIFMEFGRDGRGGKGMCFFAE